MNILELTLLSKDLANTNLASDRKKKVLDLKVCEIILKETWKLGSVRIFVDGASYSILAQDNQSTYTIF